MIDSTPKRKSPRKETLDFIKKFARIYQPNEDVGNSEIELENIQMAAHTGFC